MGLEVYQVCSNDDLWSALEPFTTRSNLLPYIHLYGKNVVISLLKTIGLNLQYIKTFVSGVPCHLKT